MQHLINHDENIIIFIENGINCYWIFRLCLSHIGRFFDQFHKLASNANLYKLGFRSLVMYPQSPLVRLFFNTATSIALRFISVSRHSPYAQDGNQILACRHDSSDFHFERMALFNTQKIVEPIRLSSN